MEPGQKAIVDHGRAVIRAEIVALQTLEQTLGASFDQAVQAILNTRGHVVLSGVGKPYIIAQKIAASLASIGVSAVALHPVDALHGDVGSIRDGDVVVLLSNSGTSNEIVEFAKATRDVQVTRIAFTCRPKSALAELCSIVVDLGDLKEADHLGGLVPSASTTAMLALGDALTLVVAKLSGVTPESFARKHPAGALGRRLRSVEAAMRGLDRTAVVTAEMQVLQVISAITERRTGAAYVVSAVGELLGIFTDGDLRRLLKAGGQFLERPVGELMTSKPKAIELGTSVSVALDIVRENHIDELPVVDLAGKLVGALDVQDLV